MRGCMSAFHIKGGSSVDITEMLDELKSKQVDGTQMWLLQPIDRTKNIYGINKGLKKSYYRYTITASFN